MSAGIISAILLLTAAFRNEKPLLLVPWLTVSLIFIGIEIGRTLYLFLNLILPFSWNYIISAAGGIMMIVCFGALLILGKLFRSIFYWILFYVSPVLPFGLLYVLIHLLILFLLCLHFQSSSDLLLESRLQLSAWTQGYWETERRYQRFHPISAICLKLQFRSPLKCTCCRFGWN